MLTFEVWDIVSIISSLAKWGYMKSEEEEKRVGGKPEWCEGCSGCQERLCSLGNR